jgi:acylphosphatase
MSQAECVAVRAIVSGKVQGVGYRFSTIEQAQKLGVKGWVRNLANGNVEAVLEGDRNLVEAMIKWCHSGPRSAVVKNVFVESIEVTGIKDFSVKH